jgi:UPF0755 protein
LSPAKSTFSFRRVLFNVVAILVLGAIGVAGYLYERYRNFTDAPIAGVVETTSIDVSLGMNLPVVVAFMAQQGLEPGNPLYWRVLARQMDVAGKLHAGEYQLDPGITPRLLLKKMATGEVIQHHFTIVEGWNFAQLRAALALDTGLVPTLANMSDSDVAVRLNLGQASPEGLFLPETYSYVKGMTDADLLRRAAEAMHRELDKFHAAAGSDTPLDTPYKALILASIVEKETARGEERPQIARVFLNRLKLGMKLQTDPTVIYGLGANYDGNLHRRDLETDTPYNTYTRSALPPTPIAMPGKAALDAVMHPATTEALYFVARGDGTHEFSTTLEAHNRAVAKYQLHRG